MDVGGGKGSLPRGTWPKYPLLGYTRSQGPSEFFSFSCLLLLPHWAHSSRASCILQRVQLYQQIRQDILGTVSRACPKEVRGQWGSHPRKLCNLSRASYVPQTSTWATIKSCDGGMYVPGNCLGELNGTACLMCLTSIQTPWMTNYRWQLV